MKNLALAITLRFIFILFILIVFVYISYGQSLEQYEFPKDYRGVIHVHSELSRDSGGKLADILKAAENNNIDFVVTTDHWSPDLYKKSYNGFWGDVLFIAGAEISKNDGITLIAFPLPQNFVPQNNWRENVTDLHKSGALALASHIEFSETAKLIGTDGVEITNLHAMLVDRSYLGFLWIWLEALWPTNQALAYLFDKKIVKNIPRWHYLNQSVPMPAFLGNDTHDNYKLFYLFGPKLGSYKNTFKLVTSHIWASELSEKSVKEAVKNGQSYFAFEIFGRTDGFKFYAANNETIFIPGTTAPAQSTIVLQAPPHENPKNTKLKILRDGKVVKEGIGILLTFETQKTGNYYGEIWKDDKPWIFANPIKTRSN